MGDDTVQQEQGGCEDQSIMNLEKNWEKLICYNSLWNECGSYESGELDHKHESGRVRSPCINPETHEDKFCPDFYLWNPSGNVERSEMFVKAEIVLELKLLRKQKLVDCYLAEGQEDM
ncbi:hypothetical protein BTVI_82434 [Pitangus sulphuratus]|nr:hypothetical protein BTVI_82434 [Pitangus sulphuratus]